jgi:hypothetical protein
MDEEFGWWRNFSGLNIVDSATLDPGYELTGARSAPDKNLRVWEKACITIVQTLRETRKFFRI